LKKLNVDGTQPDDSNLLNSTEINGASTSAFSFNSRVFIRSLKHRLSGSARTTVMTSPMLTDQNCEKLQPDGTGVNISRRRNEGKERKGKLEVGTFTHLQGKMKLNYHIKLLHT